MISGVYLTVSSARGLRKLQIRSSLMASGIAWRRFLRPERRERKLPSNITAEDGQLQYERNTTYQGRGVGGESKGGVLTRRKIILHLVIGHTGLKTCNSVESNQIISASNVRIDNRKGESGNSRSATSRSRSISYSICFWLISFAAADSPSLRSSRNSDEQ